MVSSTLLVAALAATTAASPALRFKRQYNSTTNGTNATLESFIAQQRNIALPAALKNIGGTPGNDVPGADPGVVVASPSTVNPNYFYTWTRDSALTYLMVIDEWLFGNASTGGVDLEQTIKDYASAQAVIQTITNPSGALWPDAAGLGEPKYYANKTRFNDPWGRPQNDGPALRASALMEYAEGIYKDGAGADTIKSQLWPVIINDLKYTGQYWNTSSYDLWEEVNGNSFFTTTAQHRALVQGSIWAERLGETCEPCNQAPEILCFLKNSFWAGDHIIANINPNQVLTRTQIGVDPIIGALHAFDIEAPCDAGPLQPCNSRTLATHKTVTDVFRNLYPINDNASAPAAVAIGRYPEDVYYDGNPWYLTTLAMAEVLYDAAAQIKKDGILSIDETSLAFYKDIYPAAFVGRYSGSTMNNILAMMTKYADGFVEVVQKYTPVNGTLNEQINKTTGEGTSAIALTWSFASFVTMSERRAGQFPPSWGAGSDFANQSPSTCSFSAYNSTFDYAAAVSAGAPEIETPCVSEVVFEANVSTISGQNVYLVGNTSLFGGSLTASTPENLIQIMRTQNITAERPLWYVPAWLPPSETFAYKYVLQNQTTNEFEFENTTHYVTSSPCGSGVTVYTDDAPTFASL